MADQTVAELVPAAAGEVTATLAEADLVVRSITAREIEMRIHRWGDVADTPIGLETFERGAFDGIDATKVVLQAEEHGKPAGRGLTLENRDDGQYLVARASRTQAGDELLELANDRVLRHTSVVYDPRESLASIKTVGGKRVVSIAKAALRAVTLTWKPYYAQTAVLQVRAEPEKENTPVTAEATPQPEASPPPAPVIDMAPVNELALQVRSMTDEFKGRFEKLEERARTDAIIIPGKQPEQKGGPKFYEWAHWAARVLAGERLNTRELESRALDDVITSDNPGLVPDAFVNTLQGDIDNSRPFLESTTRIPAPATGMTIVVPVLSQRSTAAVQATEKTDIESTALQVTTDSFDAVTVAGGADVSIQMIKRAAPEFMELLMADLAEAYAGVTEAEGLDALLGAGVTSGTGALDPNDLTIGEAWTNSIQNRRRPPTHIWLSSAAVAAFIDAKADGSNTPLYGGLSANFSVGGGVGGNIMGLTPVYVPALDDTAVDVLIGPRSGFTWAEDGTFTLQVDVPSKAGRDIALVGMCFFMPRYPAAFTTYALGGG